MATLQAQVSGQPVEEDTRTNNHASISVHLASSIMHGVLWHLAIEAG